ncbi:hypothetical protein ACFRFJ_30665 [Streptomyces hydrogenans]|uniref:hypothetical protein n=1 Tax=Streptomyces hydrogenans TaxID=1873719 RepID=UPI00367B5057
MKIGVVKEFLAAVDEYWQLANDVFDERRSWKRLRWMPGVQRAPSYRQRTGSVTKRLTQAQLHLEAVSGDLVKNAVDDYIGSLRRLMLNAYNAEWDSMETGKRERDALMVALRRELDINSRPK